MNTPEPVQPAAQSARAASDIYEPDDGTAPWTLAETAAAGEAARQALEVFLEALRGCRTPLNFHQAETAVLQNLAQVAMVVRPLSAASHHIADETPLATVMPDGNHWQNPGEGYVQALLTPSQIVMLSHAAAAGSDTPAVTYLEHLLESRPEPAIPHLKRRRADWVKQSARKQELWNLQQQILDDVETRPCPSCHAAAGKRCMSASGLRTNSPHASRRKESPLARANPDAAAKAYRPRNG